MMMKQPLSTSLCASSLFFFSLFLLLLLLPVAAVPVAGATHAARPNIVSKVCKQATAGDTDVDYAFCVRALLSARGSRGAGVKELALVAVKLARTNATSNRFYLRKLLQAKVHDKYLKSCLETCRELYSDAASTLRDVRRAVRAGRLDDANIWLSSATDAATTCDQGFEDMPGLKDPMKKRNDDYFKLAVLALHIVSSLGS